MTTVFGMRFLFSRNKIMKKNVYDIPPKITSIPIIKLQFSHFLEYMEVIIERFLYFYLQSLYIKASPTTILSPLKFSQNSIKAQKMEY